MSRPTDENPLLEPTYEQYLWGGRVGWGRQGRTFGRVGALYVRDRAGSLDQTRSPSPIPRRRLIRPPT